MNRGMENKEIEELVPFGEALKLLGMKSQTLRNWCYLGKIEVVRIGRQVKFKRKTIQAVIERGTTPVREEYRW